jgi:hypothetical protein
MYTYETVLEQEIFAEMKVLFQRRFGQEWKESRFESLSTLEKEWVVHNAGVNVQRRRRMQS